VAVVHGGGYCESFACLSLGFRETPLAQERVGELDVRIAVKRIQRQDGAIQLFGSDGMTQC
jgi:hypothetical protein